MGSSYCSGFPELEARHREGSRSLCPLGACSLSREETPRKPLETVVASMRSSPRGSAQGQKMQVNRNQCINFLGLLSLVGGDPG